MRFTRGWITTLAGSTPELAKIPMSNLLRRNYYFIPALLGLLICFLSISQPAYQSEIQKTVLSLGIFLGVVRVLWGERANPRFWTSLALIAAIHALVLIAIRDWFPLRSMWYLGIIGVFEIFILVVVSYKVMGLHKEE